LIQKLSPSAGARLSALTGRSRLKLGPSLTGLRIALYSPDSYGLGHFRRNRRIAEALVAAFPEAGVLLLTGCPAADRFAQPPRTDIVRLPAAVRHPDGSYTARTLGVGPDHLTVLRSALLKAALNSFEPQILIVDHNPAGRAGELKAALGALNRHGRPALVALGLRDILDDAAEVRRRWLRDGVYELLRWAYDEVWIFGRREVFDTVGEYGVPPKLASRFHYLGYAIGPKVRRRRPERHVPVVVASGGGGEDARPMLETVIRARRRSKRRFRLIVLAGPLMGTPDRKALEAEGELAGPDVSVRGFTQNPIALLRMADCVVTMGGYNSLLEALSLGIPNLVLPRAWHLEPRVRAERMEAQGWTSCLPADQATPENVLTRLLALLEGEPQSRVPAEYLTGLVNLVARCQAVVSAAQAGPLQAAESPLA